MIGLESSTLVRLGAIAVAGSLAASLVACGGAGEARSPAKAMSEPEATSVEEAQQQIAAAKAELANASSRSESAPAKSGTFAQPPGGDAARPADTSPPAPPMQSKKPSSPESSTLERDSRTTADDRCSSPCRALASMRRAVSALCRMTGTDDARCADAKRTLAESEGRVSPCSC